MRDWEEPEIQKLPIPKMNWRKKLAQQTRWVSPTRRLNHCRACCRGYFKGARQIFKEIIQLADQMQEQCLASCCYFYCGMQRRLQHSSATWFALHGHNARIDQDDKKLAISWIEETVKETWAQTTMLKHFELTLSERRSKSLTRKFYFHSKKFKVTKTWCGQCLYT